MTKRNKSMAALFHGLLSIMAAAAMLALFFAALDDLKDGRKAGELERLEQVLHRGCAAYYAEEGVYPPELSELEQRYGIRIDGRRYTVFYTASGENLFPDITVLERSP